MLKIKTFCGIRTHLYHITMTLGMKRLNDSHFFNHHKPQTTMIKPPQSNISINFQWISMKPSWHWVIFVRQIKQEVASHWVVLRIRHFGNWTLWKICGTFSEVWYSPSSTSGLLVLSFWNSASCISSLLLLVFWHKYPNKYYVVKTQLQTLQTATRDKQRTLQPTTFSLSFLIFTPILL